MTGHQWDWVEVRVVLAKALVKECVSAEWTPNSLRRMLMLLVEDIDEALEIIKDDATRT